MQNTSETHSTFIFLVVLSAIARTLCESTCDVIVTQSSTWRCKTNEHQSNFASDLPASSSNHDDITIDFANGFESNAGSGLSSKTDKAFRFCVEAPAGNAISLNFSTFPLLSADNRKRAKAAKHLSNRIPSLCPEPRLVIWQRVSLQRHKRHLSPDDRELMLRDRGKQLLLPNKRLSHKRSNLPRKKRCIRLKRHNERAKEHQRTHGKRIKRATSAAWSTMLRFCPSAPSKETRIASKSTETLKTLLCPQDASSRTSTSSNQICLFSTINKLIVDVRWPKTTDLADLVLIFRFHRQTTDSTNQNQSAAETTTTVPATAQNVGKPWTRVPGWGIVLMTVIAICIASLLVCALRSRDFCQRREAGACDTYRHSSTLQDRHQVEMPQDTNWTLLTCGCRHDDREVLGSNPVDAATAKRSNTFVQPNCCFCCCSGKLLTTGHVRSTSRTAFMTSSSGLKPSRSNSTTYGARHNAIFRAPDFRSFDLNDPNNRSNTVREPIPHPGRKMRRPLSPNSKAENSATVKAPPNKTYNATENRVIAALRNDGHVTARAARHSQVTRKTDRHVTGSVNRDRTLETASPLLSLSKGGLNPGSRDRVTCDDPPPEYSEPPEYTACV